MRHTIPYSFIDKLVENKLKTTNFVEIIKVIDNSIKIFISDRKGFCISEKDYKEEWYPTTNIELKEFCDKKLSTKEDICYLLDIESDNYTFFFNSYKEENKLDQAHSFYHQKNNQFIDSFLKYLNESIRDDNTKIIAMELLTRAIYTIFNQRANAAFPDEKNTINYSIRLFDSLEDAEYTGKRHKEYIILDADEVIAKIDKKEDLNSRIRIVDDEGPFLKHVFKVLDHLNKLMVLTKITDNDNKEYNKLEYYSNQKSQFSFKLAEPYKVQLLYSLVFNGLPFIVYVPYIIIYVIIYLFFQKRNLYA